MKHTLSVNRNVTVTKIALTGQLRSGKDTVAAQLFYEYGFERFAFGNALKHTAYEVFPWLKSEAKPRRLFQMYGQTMRLLDENVWITHVERAVNFHVDYAANSGKDNVGVVVTDVRQPNEVAWCRENGFTLIRVVAPEHVRIDRALKAGDDFNVHDLAHETELQIGKFAVDYEIVNDGTVEDLERKVSEILAEINAVK